MAREQRYDVDYFPHSCTHGRKMHIIETKYGNDGYASWFKLLEQLGKANFHYIDISDEMNLMFLVSIFKTSQETTLSILNDLSKLGAIDKFLFENYNIIYSQKFVESIKDAYRKRKSEIIEYSDLLIKISAKNNQTGGSLAQGGGSLAEVIPKEKKRKVKERKEEKNKGVFELENNQEFEDKICDFFSQTKEVLRMRLNSYLRSLKNKGILSDFISQTTAYMEFKKKSKEKAHGWLSYQTEWDSSDWIDKLSKLNQSENKLNQESKSQSNLNALEEARKLVRAS